MGLVGDLESAPQNRHGSKAYGPGYFGNFSGYEIHRFGAQYAFGLNKASLSSEKLLGAVYADWVSLKRECLRPRLSKMRRVASERLSV